MSLRRATKDMLRRVFVCGNAGYFHDEVVTESWGARKRCLEVLKQKGLLRTSTTREHPPRLLWNLTPDGAQVARTLWCPSESVAWSAEADTLPAPSVAVPPVQQTQAIALHAMQSSPSAPRDLSALDDNQARLAQARADYQAAVARAEAAVARSVALRTEISGDKHG